MLAHTDQDNIADYFPVQCCSWANITQIKTLCNVVQEAPNNNAQEKILFNVVLKEPQTISIYWFYLLHNYVVMSTKSK